jgi:hypothetical protein
MRLEGIKERKKISKALSIADGGGLYVCEIVWSPRCVDNWLTDGGEVLSLTRQPLSTPQNCSIFLVLISVTALVNLQA